MRSPTRGIRNASPVPLAAAAGRAIAGLTGTRNDAIAQMQAMGSIGTLFGIVHKTSTGTAKVEWQLERESRRGEPVVVERHAALDLWAKPNPFMSRYDFVETVQQHLDLTGEMWWIVARDPRFSIPLELWPVRPDRMAPVPHPTEFISGYVYRGPEGQLVPLGIDEVIFTRMPNPMDPYRGMGPVQAILRAADSQRFGIEWNRNFFINSAEPGGFVVFKRTLSDPEFKKWQERWREQHQGVAAAHRVGVLENAEWQERKMTQRDMQFAQLVDVTRDMIREAFTIHKASLGLADDVNKANALAAESMFANDLLVPRLDRIAGALNQKLLPLFDADPALEFCYEDPRPDDPEDEREDLRVKTEAAMQFIDHGADWDETMAAFGLPVIPMAETDPDRDLLVKLVTGAPSLAPLILPMLGFDLPEVAPAPAVDAPPAAVAAAERLRIRATRKRLELPPGPG